MALRRDLETNVTPVEISVPPCPIPNELRILAWSGLRGQDREEWLRPLLNRELDWQLLSAFARRHGMVPLLYAAVQDGRLGDPPAVLLEALAGETRAQRVRAAQQVQDLERVLRAFDDAELPVLVLKGAPLSFRLYGDPALRQAKDIDLLVRPRDKHAASAILLEHGYQLVGPPRSPAQDWFLERFGTTLTFLHPVRGTTIEVNWVLHQRPDWSVDSVLLPNEPGGEPQHQLAPSPEALDLLAHGAKHSWHRLKWLTDLWRAWECYDVDWASWRQEVACAGLEPALASALLLRRWILPGSPPPDGLRDYRSGGYRGALLARWACRQVAEEQLPSRFQIGRLAGKMAVELWAAPPAFRRRRLRSGFLSRDDFGVVELPPLLYGFYPVVKPVLWSIRYWREWRGRSATGPNVLASPPPTRPRNGGGGTYRLFGLEVSSDIDMPLVRAPGNGRADVEIRLARGLAAHANGRGRLLSVPASGWIFVRDDASIFVEPAPGASVEDVRLYLLGSVAGSICWTRGWVPLHATAVRFDGGALLFAGASGVGKSTLAAACVAAGGELLSDDLSPIRISPNGLPVLPGVGPRRLKLWRDAAERFAAGMPHAGFVQVGSEKLEFGAAAVEDGSVRADALICLDAEPDAVQEEPLRGADALNALTSNVYRLSLAPDDAAARILELAANLCERLRIVRVPRPDSLDGVARLAERLASGWPTREP